MIVREEAFPFAAPPALAAALLGALGHPVWALVPALFALAVCGFFRDPERIPPEDPSALVSPADGRVIKVERREGRVLVSIFMSVFDVHVNRAPWSAKVEGASYNRGKFLAAWDDKASLDNEQMRLSFSCEQGSFDVVQIAGLIARRIVSWAPQGWSFARGERIGLIRFGSRVDLYLEEARVAVAAQVGQRVSAGTSVLARWEERT
jgi:phosphatidylserine decarboxylase